MASAVGYGTGVHERRIRGLNVLVDGRNATISAAVPDSVDDCARDDVIYTNPADLLRRRGILPSLALLRYAKVKNFIDGVYAAVEQRAAEGGHRMSRRDLLAGLLPLTGGDARRYVSAAIAGESSAPDVNVTQGFYDWTEDLRAAYRQIRILGKGPASFNGASDDGADRSAMRAINRALENGAALNAAYSALTQLYARMTGPPVEVPALFPPAQMPDHAFFMALSRRTQGDIEGGLGKALVEAVRRGEVDFTPSEGSGLYLRQMHEIAPLVRRDTEEFRKLLVDKRYGKILDGEFVSQWAGTRHTHVARSPFHQMLIGAAMPSSPPIEISPELAVEPFPTCYDRMGASLHFLQQTLEGIMPDVLDLKRIMNDGSRAGVAIGEELEYMRLLVEGLGLVARDSLHMPYENGGQYKSAKNPGATASRWLEVAAGDPDVNRNTAIFVPIVRTTDGTNQIAYINAGFRAVDVDVSYEAPPAVTIEGEHFFGHRLVGRRYTLPVLVHREVRVPYGMPINDRRLREILGSASFTTKELDAKLEELQGHPSRVHSS